MCTQANILYAAFVFLLLLFQSHKYFISIFKWEEIFYVILIKLHFFVFFFFALEIENGLANMLVVWFQFEMVKPLWFRIRCRMLRFASMRCSCWHLTNCRTSNAVAISGVAIENVNLAQLYRSNANCWTFLKRKK